MHGSLPAQGCSGGPPPPPKPGFMTPAFIGPPPTPLPTKPQPIPCRGQAPPNASWPSTRVPTVPAAIQAHAPPPGIPLPAADTPPAAGTASPLLAPGILLQAIFLAGMGGRGLSPVSIPGRGFGCTGADALCGSCSRHCLLPAAWLAPALGSSCPHSSFPKHRGSLALKINLNKQEGKRPVPPTWYIHASKTQMARCSQSPSQMLNWLNIHGCPFPRTPRKLQQLLNYQSSQGCHQETSLMRIKNNSIKKSIPERSLYLFLRGNPPLFRFCFFKH